VILTGDRVVQAAFARLVILRHRALPELPAKTIVRGRRRMSGDIGAIPILM
jgi:hypothetical protein